MMPPQTKAELLAASQFLQVMFSLDLARSNLVCVDVEGKLFQVVVLPEKPKDVKRSLFTPKCAALCGYALERPHLGCIRLPFFGLSRKDRSTCTYRQIAEGKAPMVQVGKVKGAIIPIETLYFCTVKKNRRFPRLKRFLFKQFAVLLEVTSN